MKKFLLLALSLILVLTLLSACGNPGEDTTVLDNTEPESELKVLSEDELIELFEVAYGGYEVVDGTVEERIELELGLLEDLAYVSGSILPDNFEELYLAWRPAE